MQHIKFHTPPDRKYLFPEISLPLSLSLYRPFSTCILRFVFFRNVSYPSTEKTLMILFKRIQQWRPRASLSSRPDRLLLMEIHLRLFYLIIILRGGEGENFQTPTVPNTENGNCPMGTLFARPLRAQ